MASLFGVQTVFKNISKKYKSAVNSFQKQVLVIPERDQDVLYTRRVRHSKSVTNYRRQTRLHLVFKTFLRYPADVSFADKRLKYLSQTSSSPKLTKDVFVTTTYGSLGCVIWYP